jgi:NAD(P)-dependent dehydrogenase (short-subunit alcohol dehydrogenase family)
VVTGSTGGIGTEIIKILAGRGDDLVLVNRSRTKSETQAAQLKARYPDLKVEVIVADLMDTAQVSAAVNEIVSLPGRIDVLYNNSGILTSKKVLSPQGFESQFAVNTLAPYALILRLRERMARPSGETPAMVINFSSSAINGQKSLDLGNLANPEQVGGLLTTYAQTKLAVTVLSAALSEGLKSRNIFIRAVDPGATKTSMTTGGNSGMPKPLQWLAPLFFSPANKQAAKIVDSAAPAAFSAQTGIYVANRKVKKLPGPAADAETGQQLVALLDGLLKKHNTEARHP